MDSNSSGVNSSNGHEAAPVSRIVIEFAGIGSAEFKTTPNLENVNPMQILAVAGWLEWAGRMMLNQAQAQASQQLIIPTPKLPNIRI